MRERRPRLIAATLLASFLFVPSLSYAQAGFGHLEDGSLPPRGLLRLRAITVFTRYDSRFSANGVELLGAPFTADSLGSRTLSALSSIESLVQTASGTPSVTLSLGRSRLDATGREESLPIAFEYGLTDRFAVGVTIPVVRKRLAAQFLLDSTGANVGPNPARTSGAAELNNAQVQAEFAAAQANLQQRIAFCQNPANQTNPNCAAVLADPSGAQQLLQSSQAFASDIFSLYGGAGATGMAFVPVTQSVAQLAIESRVTDFNTQYQTMLVTSTPLIQAVPRAAGGPAGSVEFQDYLARDLGGDSLNFQERIGIGDIEVGFRMRLLDNPRRNARGTGMRLTLASAVRLPTGSRESPSQLMDLRLGEGAVIVDSRAVFDARVGRLGLLAAGHFAANVHSNDTSNTASRNSRWMELQVAPRWHLSEPFAIHGAYSLRSTDKLGGDQLVGAGLSFSTLSAYRRGTRPLPMEMRFTHLEAISGDAGRPKFFRDQIELRIYSRLR
jgi:hypothetical protein